jgi:pimeloyl-ACP methyl ester carboxylesterase
MLDLSDDYYCLAPDLRGYGKSDPDKIIDATRGMLDWVDDLDALVKELTIGRVHLVGHSLGGSVCWSAAAAIGSCISSMTLMAPGPPCGFGGIYGKEAHPNNSDFSGSGAGVVNQTFASNLLKGVRETDNSMFSPRSVMNRIFWRDGFHPEREEDILTALMQIHTGDKRYPGDYETSDFWPGVSPGLFGPVNALSPKYNMDVADQFANAEFKPPVLWIFGDDDQIISDESLSDPGYQGKAGFREGWPGEAEFPAQPMEQQIRHLLNRFRTNGGHADEMKIRHSGHTPFMEQPEVVYPALRRFLNNHTK